MLQIDKQEAEYMRANGVYVSMTNRGKRSKNKRYYLTESMKNMNMHRRYLDIESKKVAN